MPTDVDVEVADDDAAFAVDMPSDASDSVSEGGAPDDASQVAWDRAVDRTDPGSTDANAEESLRGEEADAEDGDSTPGPAEQDATGTEETVGLEGTADGVAVAATASGVGAAYRTGTPELKRHGGTTAEELGVHARGGMRRTQTPTGVRRRIAAVGIVPALTTLVVLLAVATFALLPVLRQQQADAAARMALSYAATVEGVSLGLPLAAPLVGAVLSDIVTQSQARLHDLGVAFVVIADEDGIPLAGWSGARVGVTGLAPDVARAVAEGAAASTNAAGLVDSSPESLGQSIAATWSSLLAMVGLAEHQAPVASAAIRDGDVVVGTVVVALSDAPLWSATGQALWTMLLLGLIPVAIAILMVIALSRRVVGGLRYLLDATDRISRGDLDNEVKIDSNDELGQLARGVERMRVSLQEGLERLRRRR